MGCQIKYRNQSRSGFSLMEVLVVLGIISVLASLSASAYSGFKSHENLNLAANEVVEALRLTQSDAQSGRGDSQWGVKLQSRTLTIFKGASSLTSDPAWQQNLDLPSGVTASGLSEIVFDKLTGTTPNTGIITLTNSLQTKTLTINAKGVVTY